MKHFSTTPPGPGRHLLTRLRPYLAALLLLLAAPLVRAQAPAWQTAVGVGGATDRSGVFATAADASGNVYVAGGFYGSITLGNATLVSAGLRDLFVAKWSPTTNAFLWAQRAGGPGDDYVNSVALSGSSVYLAGVFGSSQLQLGSTTLTNVNALPSGINFDGYVAKLTDAGTGGTFVWAQGFGGTGTDYGNAIALNGGNVYVAGIFASPTLNFGTAVTLTNASTGTSTVTTTDVYLAKFTDAGSTGGFVWAERLGSTGGEFCAALAFGNGSLYLGGSFNSPAVTLGGTTLSNASNNTGTSGTEDVFVARLTDLGSAPAYEWAQRGGGPGPDQALRIAVVPGSVYIAGRITSSASGITTNFGPVVVPISGITDGYVAKLSDTGTAGTFVWAQGFGGPSGDYAYALAVRGRSVYVGGVFQLTASFGPNIVTSRGLTDVFVTRLVDAGPTAQVAWVQPAGGTGTDDLFSLLLVDNRIYAGGDVTPPATFGSLSLAAPVGVGSVAYLASITDPVGLATTPAGPLAGTSLYPNPAHATATVQLPPVPGATCATLTITDALGRVARTATVALPAAGLRHELDLTGLPAGLYAVRVAAGDRSATHRLMVE